MGCNLCTELDPNSSYKKDYKLPRKNHNRSRSRRLSTNNINDF